MHLSDRYAVVDWREVRRHWAMCYEIYGKSRSMREIQGKTGIAPSTLVRWGRPDDKPVDLGKMVQVVELLGIAPSEFFARIEGLTPTRRTDQELPSPIPSIPKADHGRSVLSDVDRTFILAIGEALAESFDRAVDRLAATRSQAAPTGGSEPVRRARRRKVG